jgi:hypothetical protein
MFHLWRRGQDIYAYAFGIASLSITLVIRYAHGVCQLELCSHLTLQPIKKQKAPLGTFSFSIGGVLLTKLELGCKIVT